MHLTPESHAADTLAPFTLWSYDSEGTPRCLDDYTNLSSAKAAALTTQKLSPTKTIKVYDNVFKHFVTHPSLGLKQ